MSFFEAIATAFKKYATFTGTAGRPEFWWFALFVYLGAAALNALNLITPQGTIYLGSSLSAVFGLAVLLPYLAVTVRRLRDTGRSWANLFWLLLPIAGLIVLIVLLAQPGTSAQAQGRLPDNTVRA
ncbi:MULTISPECIES: DUF805 domain-containing protein [Leifsonia]|uniref:Uncharacterized membrane protein YhaH (DUF805 family) n=1 Tax=Leifsonia soli TaxID=582665 RepID=A0A852T1X0_9MICO|nr:MULTISPECIES: DUF805 domain-containing protein [Leifsonia]NYD74610.1 uncharacterized membrane protein YhaH (DUF805 family) [Leifsonia soli]SEA50651.1 Uncharacterized membrane protein YhaH, DUF805 family [Leifsonia sp. 21MFCrub1.1]